MCVSSYEDKMSLYFKLDGQLKSMSNRATELHIGSIRNIGHILLHPMEDFIWLFSPLVEIDTANIIICRELQQECNVCKIDLDKLWV